MGFISSMGFQKALRILVTGRTGFLGHQQSTPNQNVDWEDCVVIRVACGCASGEDAGQASKCR